jgi:hypothetical protein
MEVDVDRHVTVVGVLDLALGLAGLIGAPFILISMVGGGLATGDWPPMVLVPLMGIGITLLVLILSIPTLVAGVALLRGAKWARSFGLFAAALNLVSFPIGTPIGAYGLWALSRLPRQA